MYADQTNGLHMEFVFSLQNCRAEPLAEGELIEYAEDESLQLIVATVDYFANSDSKRKAGPV
jgi:hypothetical protein